MRMVGVRELGRRTSEIIRWVREEGRAVKVTYYGRVVARLMPVAPAPSQEVNLASLWSDLDQLAAEIGARWPDGVTAAEAVAEGRREL